MAKSVLGALALASLPSALAFRNTSPYLLFSTADLNLPAPDADVASASSVIDQFTGALAGCPSKTYFVVRQDGISSADFADTSRSAPRLAYSLNGKSEYVKSSLVVPEVIEDDSSASAVIKFLQSKCGAERLSVDGPVDNSETKRIVEVSFTAPRGHPESRKADLGDRDNELQLAMSKWADLEDFTVIYTSTPQKNYHAETPPYEMETPFGSESVQMELKRDLSSHTRATAAPAPYQKQAALFERYQYFTPGLFMAFAAIIPLFLIVVVGVKALLSLEVSYFAFSKEMGPAAQRKQQ